MVAAALAAAAAVFLLDSRAWGLEVKLVTLVQARDPGWRPAPPEAVMDRGRLSFKKKVFLESRAGIRVWAPEVKRALAEALASLPERDRGNLGRALGAIGGWAKKNLRETAPPLACPGSWRGAREVLREKSGNRFEIARALVAILRAAGVPARPTFNGAPVVYHYVTAPGGKNFWTVWDPFGWSGCAERLPVLWLPLRAGEVSPVAVKRGQACPRPTFACRRYESREKAETAFSHVKKKGVFPEEGEKLPGKDWENWWEVWTIGAGFDSPPAGAVELVFAVPFVKDLGFGTREHGFWVSDPRRSARGSRINARTDQTLGGLALSVRVRLAPAVSRAAGRDG